MIGKCPPLFTPPVFYGPVTRLHLRRRKVNGMRISLQCRAMRSLQAAARDLDRLGIQWRYTSGSDSDFRPPGRQCELCNGICGGGCAGCPGLCAPAGYSAHEIGLGLDACAKEPRDNDRFWRVLKNHGWSRPLPSSDPCHNSYGVNR